MPAGPCAIAQIKTQMFLTSLNCQTNSPDLNPYVDYSIWALFSSWYNSRRSQTLTS